MDYEIQFSRLATAEKLPDRFLNTQLKGNADLAKSSMGEVFSLVEILTPWFPTAQIGQTIIQVFSDSYWQGASTSDLVNFEAALKKVNENLATLTQNGETDWLGNLNAVLGVIIDNKLHLAQTGKAEAYVFRDGKINHLTEGLAQGDSEPHPLSTFSNITSGEIKHNDKLLIANPELYKHLSLENLRQIISMSSPSEAILQIAKLLKKKKVNRVNALIIHWLTSEELAQQPAIEAPETIYLDKPFDSLIARGQKLWHDLLLPILKFMGNKGKKAGNQSLAFSKNYLSTLRKKREENVLPKKRDLYEKEFISQDSQETLLNDEEITYSPDLEVHYYNENKKARANKWLQFSNRWGGKIIPFFGAFLDFLNRSRQNKRTRPYFFASCAIILLIIVVLFVRAERSTSNNFNLNEAQNTLHQAENYEQDAENALLRSDTENAKILFTQAIDEAEKIKGAPVVGSAANDVLAKAYANLDKLTSATRFQGSSPILTLDKKANSFYLAAGNVYFGVGGDIYKGLLSGGTPSKIASLPTSGGDVLMGTIMGQNIYFYSSAQKIYELDPASDKLIPAQISGSWETANSLSSYNGSLYLLDGVIGQVYRHTSTSDSFSAGSAYLTSQSVDLKASNSIAVDGAVYILKNDGSVLKFQRSKLQDFALKNIPSPNATMQKPLKLFTDPDASSLYVLDQGQKRIVEFDKNGNFVHQYVFPELGDITDFSVNIKAKKMYLLSEKNLYEVGI